MGLGLSHCRAYLLNDDIYVDDGRFIDSTFPPVDSSLGDAKPGRLFISQEQRSKTRWIRLPELLHFNQEISSEELAQRNQSELKWQGMTAGDLAQGFLGNCWLVASIAAIIKQPTWIRKLFVEADLVAGHFVIQLYDMASARWELVEVDDFVPCTLEDDWSDVPYAEQEDGTRVYNYNDIYTAQGTKCLRKKWLPLFGRPKGRQVWALILEKAMAKFVGSYAHLSGGTEPFAFMALTGFPLVYVFQRPAVDQEETAALENHWQWRGAQYAGRNATGIGSVSLPVPDDLLDEELWEKLLRYMSRRCPVTASITRYPAVTNARDYYRNDGLISGHAYAMLEARELQLKGGQMLRLVALKNPHGDWKAEGGAWSCTWTGDWGHESSSWERHPEVAWHLEAWPP
ncbi:Calpain-1 catalytic subunit (Calcium-activated neutral proteinase 1) (CANP 1) (Calpain mu-type) (Calpain-1 large subunit) (Micromolar-calpain) (muCANP) [Durusdinium trenchii]|uniref:Calpain-1 catalytic subunit (Calcium-activated neutral proteinase 1) (CANP 1) (Calpain mu-type) (Calpain-1 large subunit) (Micromolar-calpain) (MuCANP) n=1 Tax=Durusdinium trenchii TaxID=1381693 RepID=A0ABP0SQV4_9DINO